MPTSIFPLVDIEVLYLKWHRDNEIQQSEPWDITAKETPLRNSWHFLFIEEHNTYQ